MQIIAKIKWNTLINYQSVMWFGLAQKYQLKNMKHNGLKISKEMRHFSVFYSKLNFYSLSSCANRSTNERNQTTIEKSLMVKSFLSAQYYFPVTTIHQTIAVLRPTKQTHKSRRKLDSVGSFLLAVPRFYSIPTQQQPTGITVNLARVQESN